MALQWTFEYMNQEQSPLLKFDEDIFTGLPFRGQLESFEEMRRFS